MILTLADYKELGCEYVSRRESALAHTAEIKVNHNLRLCRSRVNEYATRVRMKDATALPLLDEAKTMLAETEAEIEGILVALANIRKVKQELLAPRE